MPEMRYIFLFWFDNALEKPEISPQKASNKFN